MYEIPERSFRGPSRFDLLLRWDLDAISLLLSQVSDRESDIESRTDRGGSWITEDGSLTPRASREHARILALEGIVHLLNAVVDGALFGLASRILPIEASTTRQAMSRPRCELIRAIEEHYRVRTRFLPSWQHIEETREDANALKHRYGQTFPTMMSIGIRKFDAVRLSVQQLEARIDGTREWLMALWTATELAEWERENEESSVGEDLHGPGAE